MFETILIEGLIYGIMALGVFITYKVLDFPDLTVDGSFPLGAVIMAVGVMNGIPPLLVLPVAFLGGAAAGSITALIHNTLKIPNLLAGILTMTMLYSINLRITGGRPNISYLTVDNTVKSIRAISQGYISEEIAILLFFLFVAFLIKIMLDLFFKTDMGLTLGALGNNEQMTISQGVNPKLFKVIGVSLSNGLVAVSGAFASQYQGSADVRMGTGIVVMGLASVMIGQFLIRSNKIGLLTLRVLLGSIILRGVMQGARQLDFLKLEASDNKLIYGLFIVILLAVSTFKSKKPGKIKK